MANENFQTFGNVVDDAYDELSISSSNGVPGLSQAQMESWANRFSKIFLEKVHLRTQEETTSFEAIADTTLSAAAISGATSLTITSSTGFPSSGLVLVDNIPMTFTRSSLTLTVSAIPRALASGDTVQPAYALQTDFGKPRSIWVDGAYYEIVRYGDDETLPSRSFALYKGYLILPKARTAGTDVTFHYYAKGANTLTDADNMEIYQMWDGYVVYKLTARGHRLLNGGLETVASTQYEGQAREMMMMAKQMVASEDNSLNPSFRPGW